MLMETSSLLTANLCILAAGAMLGWTSPVTVELEKYPVSLNNPIGAPITEVESSWIGSLLTIGAICGSFIAGWMSEKYFFLLFSSLHPFFFFFTVYTSVVFINFFLFKWFLFFN